MRASTFVFAFAASAFAAGVDSTAKFDEITAPQGTYDTVEKAVAAGKLCLRDRCSRLQY
jgi:hypothetical protein